MYSSKSRALQQHITCIAILIARDTNTYFHENVQYIMLLMPPRKLSCTFLMGVNFVAFADDVHSMKI